MSDGHFLKCHFDTSGNVVLTLLEFPPQELWITQDFHHFPVKNRSDPRSGRNSLHRSGSACQGPDASSQPDGYSSPVN